MLKPLRSILFLALALLLSSSVYAQAPQLINFQAQVSSLPAGPTPVTFSIYGSASGGSALWSESHSITSPDGVIQVLLGSEMALPSDLFSSDGERHLELNINGEVLSPRFQLTSVSYALRAAVADEVADGGAVTTLNELSGDVALREGANVTITQDGQEITIAAAITGGGGGGGITTVSGGSGIEVTDPNGPLAVVNVEEDGLNDTHIEDNSLTAASLANGAVGSSELANGAAVRSINGISDGVTLVGGNNVTVSTNGQEVTIDAAGGAGGGISSLVAGNGIDIDNANGPTSTIGLQSQILLGPTGELAIGNGANTPVASMANGDGGGGFEFIQTDGNFPAGGLSVRSFGGSSFGGQLQLRGNPNWDALHLFADGSSQGGRLVMREPIPGNQNDAYTTLTLRGDDGKGHIIVLENGEGSISIGGANQDIRVKNRVGIGLLDSEYESNNQLVDPLYVRGDATITGNLSNSIGTSIMDHPSDPENMTLSHSEIISSERMTVYSGNVILGPQGEATVQLPDWFESLNTDFRYQLTTIGEWARVYVAEKISDNQFRIAGGRNGLEVSWQITAVRNDPYALSNPVEIEQAKAPGQAGTYLNPEAYGATGNQ